MMKQPNYPMIQRPYNLGLSVTRFFGWSILGTSVSLTNVSGISGSLDYEEQSRVKGCRIFDVAQAMKWRSTLLWQDMPIVYTTANPPPHR